MILSNDSIIFLIFSLKPNLSIDNEAPDGTECSIATGKRVEPSSIASFFNRLLAESVSIEPRLFEQTNSAGKEVVCAPV